MVIYVSQQSNLVSSYFVVKAHGFSCGALTCSLFGQMDRKHQNIQILQVIR